MLHTLEMQNGYGQISLCWHHLLLLRSGYQKLSMHALVDLMVVILWRPKGLFKEYAKRIQSGMQIIQEELVKLGITDGVREVDLQHSAIWMARLYLMLLMQFL